MSSQGILTTWSFLVFKIYVRKFWACFSPLPPTHHHGHVSADFHCSIFSLLFCVALLGRWGNGSAMDVILPRGWDGTLLKSHILGWASKVEGRYLVQVWFKNNEPWEGRVAGAWIVPIGSQNLDCKPNRCTEVTWLQPCPLLAKQIAAIISQFASTHIN